MSANKQSRRLIDSRSYRINQLLLLHMLGYSRMDIHVEEKFWRVQKILRFCEGERLILFSVVRSLLGNGIILFLKQKRAQGNVW